MDKKLTKLEAFNAMKLFLEKYWEQTSSDDVASLLGELQFLTDGKTIDPAAWEDWIECVNNVKDEKEIMVLTK